MDTKKAIEQLIKIAIKQQQIISKLAQQGLPPDADPRSKIDMGEGGQLRGQTQDPAAATTQATGPSRTPGKTLYDNLDSVTKDKVRHIQFDWKTNTFTVFWQPNAWKHSRNPAQDVKLMKNGLQNKATELQNKNMIMPGNYNYRYSQL